MTRKPHPVVPESRERYPGPRNCICAAVIGDNGGGSALREVWMKQPCVYMLASRGNRVLYVGVTSDLVKRVWEHKNHVVRGFTEKYNVDRLIWFELHDAMESAILREKSLKRWRRSWKLELVRASNPEMRDLYPQIID